jgi:hypothetical protein
MRIAAPKNSCRSWLLGPTHSTDLEEDVGGNKSIAGGEEKVEQDKDPDVDIAKGFAITTAELFTATSVDPLFLLLPVLSPKPSSTKSEPQKTFFLSIDDLFDNLTAISKHFGHLTHHARTKELLTQRIESVCDVVEAGDEKMYRLSHEKLLQVLVAKARRISSSGLPASMEAKFVSRALETPTMGIKREESTISVRSNEGETAANVASSEQIDSQASIDTPVTVDSQSSIDTTITVPDVQPTIPQELVGLLRLRTALSYIFSTYLPAHHTKILEGLLATSGSIDFKPLDSHLAHIAKLRAAALVSRSLGDFSRKRGNNEDDEAIASREEKKRKMDEDEKRKKAGESRGVRNLKKVNTTGMKKMSDFFGKAAVRKA